MGDGNSEGLLGFKFRQGEARASAILGRPGLDRIVIEARQIGHHFKEAVVTEGSAGSAWRMASDEGLHLGGTDRAPFPLGFFNAGLQSDLAGRIARLSHARGIVLASLAVGASTQYTLSGAFADGSAIGRAEAVGAHVAFQSSAASADLAAVVNDAIAGSPAFDLVSRPLENTFALYCNGRRRTPLSLPASPAQAQLDPFLKYVRAPEPLANAAVAADLIVKAANAPSAVAAAPTPAARPGTVSGWTIEGEGTLDPATRLYRCRVGLSRPGTSPFAFVCDETDGDRAPSGLALVSAGIAFCYMTQLSRFMEAMKPAIRGVRLVQHSPYEIAGERGRAMPCDTHLFMSGEAEEALFDRLQRVATNTCYLHQTMIKATPLKVTASNGGREVIGL